MDEIILLNRIRVDIGNVAGSLSELLQYAGMAGFNDDYEPQTKPRLVGTWTINDWYTTDQLAEAQAAFDGLTVVGDPNYVIDFSQMAVQVIDDTQPNYNPAAAIILQAAGYGNTLGEPPIPGQTGRWFINKSEAATRNLNSIRKTTVVDTNNIVSNNSGSYDFITFKEYKYFTSVTTLGAGAFQGSTKLKEIHFPESLINIHREAFYQNPNITNIFIKNSINLIPNFSGGVKFIIGDKDKYSGLKQADALYFDAGYKIKSYYEYCAPQVSFDGAEVTINVERESDIYYTTDGTTPTPSSNKYTLPFSWDGTGVIKTIAVNIVDNIIDIVYASDFYAQTTQTPLITINNNQIIITSEQNATIYFTTDGTSPTLDSNVYQTPIPITQEMGDFVKVRCFSKIINKNDSDIVTKFHIINESLWGNDSNTSSFAVQCIDSSKPNYNPAVCINFGRKNLLTEKVCGGGGYVTKVAATSITSIGSFESITVENSKLIDGNFTFESFDELIFFGNYTNGAVRTFNGCRNLVHLTLPSSLNYLSDLYVGNTSNLSYMHMLQTTPPSTQSSLSWMYGVFAGSAIQKIYVGDGTSAAHDDAILADYLADTNWATYSSRLDTWYNYLHPTS